MAPENTLRGFRTALQLGADGVELDVRRCGTGELVVCHDPTLARWTGTDVRVARTSAFALRRYDLGDGQRIPLLSEVLAALPTAVINVEIKADDDDPVELARAVAHALRSDRKHRRRVIVSSFAPMALRALRTVAPDIPRGLLLHPDPGAQIAALAWLRETSPQAIHPHHGLCTPERVRDWHAHGLKVHAWTVDEPDDLVRVARAGVDAIITNRPAQALEVLRAHGLR